MRDFHPAQAAPRRLHRLKQRDRWLLPSTATCRRSKPWRSIESASTVPRCGCQQFETLLCTDAQVQARVKHHILRYLEHAERLKRLTSGAPHASTDVADDAPTTPATAPSAPPLDATSLDERTRLDAVLHMVLTRSPSGVDWKDVAGLDDAKQVLTARVLAPMAAARDADNGTEQPPAAHAVSAGRADTADNAAADVTCIPTQASTTSHVLLYGPPGCGKAHLVRALASQARCALFTVSCWVLASKQLSEDCAALVDLLVAHVGAAAPALLFLEDVDALAADRSAAAAGPAAAATALVRHMRALQQQSAPVCVIAATSEPYCLDAALLAAFDVVQWVPPPDAAARATLLSSQVPTCTCCVCRELLISYASRRPVQLATTPTTLLDFDIAKLAQRLEGWSCADCMQLVAEAASRPLAVLQSATHFQPVHKGWGADSAYVLANLFVSCTQQRRCAAIMIGATCAPTGLPRSFTGHVLQTRQAPCPVALRTWWRARVPTRWPHHPSRSQTWRRCWRTACPASRRSTWCCSRRLSSVWRGDRTNGQMRRSETVNRRKRSQYQ